MAQALTQDLTQWDTCETAWSKSSRKPSNHVVRTQVRAESVMRYCGQAIEVVFRGFDSYPGTGYTPTIAGSRFDLGLGMAEARYTLVPDGPGTRVYLNPSMPMEA